MADRGRPSTYTPELGDVICDHIAAGATLRELTSQPDMPAWATIWRWLQANETFRAQYARAREDGADYHADRALAEALETKGKENPDVAGARLRWDALRWHAGKCAPKRYSEKYLAEVSGPEGGPVQISAIVRKVVDA